MQHHAKTVPQDTTKVLLVKRAAKHVRLAMLWEAPKATLSAPSVSQASTVRQSLSRHSAQTAQLARPPMETPTVEPFAAREPSHRPEYHKEGGGDPLGETAQSVAQVILADPPMGFGLRSGNSSATAATAAATTGALDPADVVAEDVLAEIMAELLRTVVYDAQEDLATSELSLDISEFPEPGGA